MSATPTYKKNHAAGMAISYLPPEKPLAGAARRQRKNRPSGRQFPKLCRFGAILRRSPNRFPRKSLSSARRLRARNARSPHQKNRPLIHFLRFPPPYFSFLVEKVGFSGGSTTINGRGGRASLGRQSRRATRSRQLSLSSLITYRPKL